MGTHPIFESDFDCLTEIAMRLTRPVRFYDKIRDWGPWANNYGENWQRKAAAFNTNFATNKSGVGGVADVLNPMVGENKWNRDPSNFTPDSLVNYRLDGWVHRVDSSGKSILRMPKEVDPMNWKPVSDEERDLFAKRLEHEAKTRRRFWQMEQNPATEAYFDDINTDRAWAQQGWAKSHWFLISANSPGPYWQYIGLKRLVFLAFWLWINDMWMKRQSKPGMVKAPATDIALFEIEVVDMSRNNHTPVGLYEQGQFKPFRPGQYHSDQ